MLRRTKKRCVSTFVQGYPPTPLVARLDMATSPKDLKGAGPFIVTADVNLFLYLPVLSDSVRVCRSKSRMAMRIRSKTSFAKYESARIPKRSPGA